MTRKCYIDSDTISFQLFKKYISLLVENTDKNEKHKVRTLTAF